MGTGLVGERTRIVNRIKATLTRLGIRSFNPKLRKAPERLAGLRTPEEMPLPPNTLAELRRDRARLVVVTAQIKEIEATRLEQLDEVAEQGSHPMVRLLASIIGVGIETADMLVHEILSRHLRDRQAVARYAGLTGAPDESGKRHREKGLALKARLGHKKGTTPRFVVLPQAGLGPLRMKRGACRPSITAPASVHQRHAYALQ